MTEQRLVPVQLAVFSPGAPALGYVGRDCRSNGKAPGKGPAVWTAVEPLEWIWPKAPNAAGQLIAIGVLARICGTAKRVRFLDPALLAPP